MFSKERRIRLPEKKKKKKKRIPSLLSISLPFFTSILPAINTHNPLSQLLSSFTSICNTGSSMAWTILTFRALKLTMYLLFCFLSPKPIFLKMVAGKSTIEPCNGSDTCQALLGYTLPTDLKVSEVATLFQVDPVTLLTANAYDLSYPDIENHILPARLFLKVPLLCSCVDGIRKTGSVVYRARASDTLPSIAAAVYSGLVTADQIQNANSISDPDLIDLGQPLKIPLPCTCFNGTDNGLPAVYLSYVVQASDTLPGIAGRYSTTLTDLMTVNSMGTMEIKTGDILAIPLAACSSGFPRFASDSGLVVANGSYAITASHCVQCSCGPTNMNLYCTPAPLAASCPNMQCRNSSLLVGNMSVQQTNAGCSASSCLYGGYVNGTILTSLFTSIRPQCPGPHVFPPLLAPPTVLPVSMAPSPSPSQSGGSTKGPGTLIPGNIAFPGGSPANSPNGKSSGSSMLILPLHHMLILLVIIVVVSFGLVNENS